MSGFSLLEQLKKKGYSKKTYRYLEELKYSKRLQEGCNYAKGISAIRNCEK